MVMMKVVVVMGGEGDQRGGGGKEGGEGLGGRREEGARSAFVRWESKERECQERERYVDVGAKKKRYSRCKREMLRENDASKLDDDDDTATVPLLLPLLLLLSHSLLLPAIHTHTPRPSQGTRTHEAGVGWEGGRGVDER